ncbi:methyltransferase [Thermogemmatispora carboxidivorans]|uniref:methyltransferase n=1 Tax=Thermogemmatispora carboxidivorans TaxID=1382306 RepID=UPI00069C8A25|nr:methyltransferase [Thermogemmatispora carboxidivorans]
MINQPSLSVDDLVRLGSYWETKILLTAIKLDLFTRLLERQKTAADLAREIEANANHLELLLNALVGVGVLEKRDDYYRNTPLAQSHLVRGMRFWYWAHLDDLLWHAWEQLERIILSGRDVAQQTLFEKDPEAATYLLLALYQGSFEKAQAIASIVDLSPFHTLLDIGGGAGTCSIALRLAYPHLHATIFDLPGTLPMTQQMTQQANLQDRINLIAGDVTKDGLPGIYDAVLVSHVVHWLDEEQISLLFNKVSTALEDHGMVLVRDFFLETSKTAPRQTAVFSVSLLVQGGSRCYSFDEGATWLTQAGFRRGAEKIPRELILAKKQVRDEDGRETSECGHIG